MLKTIYDLNPEARDFAQHCIESCSLRDLVNMVYSPEVRIEQCNQFNISEEQWQDAVYVAIKHIGNR
jgi:hypothetical protein